MNSLMKNNVALCLEEIQVIILDMIDYNDYIFNDSFIFVVVEEAFDTISHQFCLKL